MYLTGYSQLLMQAKNWAFPINVHGILCVPMAFASTTSYTLSLAFFLPCVLLTFSNGISNVYLGSSQKNKPVTSMLYTFLGSYFAIAAYNLFKPATRSGFSLSTSAPSLQRSYCIPWCFLNQLNHCHGALKSSCNTNSSSAIFFDFKMAREGGTGRFAQCMLSIHRYNLSSTSVKPPTGTLNVFFFASSDIRTERLQISSCFNQTFLIVASLTLYCCAILHFMRRI